MACTSTRSSAGLSWPITRALHRVHPRSRASVANEPWKRWEYTRLSSTRRARLRYRPLLDAAHIRPDGHPPAESRRADGDLAPQDPPRRIRCEPPRRPAGLRSRARRERGGGRADGAPPAAGDGRRPAHPPPLRLCSTRPEPTRGALRTVPPRWLAAAPFPNDGSFLEVGPTSTSSRRWPSRSGRW
jgi:hypothetical protein